jgi:hypothetical protein
MSELLRSRSLVVLGLLVACSCWISAAFLFGNIMGESFSEDPAEQARIAASRKMWMAVLIGAWLTGLVASAAIAGFSLRAHRVIAGLTFLVLAAFVAFVTLAALWGT